MEKLLLSAFACDPSKGSEPNNGWNWAVGLAEKGFEVHCLTRSIGRQAIEEHAKPDNLKFYYLELPVGGEKLYGFSTIGMYGYYIWWQWAAYKLAQKLHKSENFKVVHHVTWGSIQLGSFLYKLNAPFIFGPAGGGQEAPKAFQQYFQNSWAAEEKRAKVSRLLTKYNPACRAMLKAAYKVLVSNPETEALVRTISSKNVVAAADVGLPSSFFPEQLIKNFVYGELKLLWVGRFLPRKGILLVLDVMKELKSYPGITLTVVGDGEMRDPFLAKIKEYGLEQTVFWKGRVDYSEVKNFYSTHDVFFFTSLRDSGGFQLLEAMAYGLPVVTINLHGQAILVNEECGIRCRCDSPEVAVANLMDAILMLFKNPKQLEMMSVAASQFAKTHTWQKKIDNIITHSYPKL